MGKPLATFFVADDIFRETQMGKSYFRASSFSKLINQNTAGNYVTHSCLPHFLCRKSTSYSLKTSGSPTIPVKRAILYGFGKVLRLNTLAAGKVGNGACHLQDAVIGAGR